MAANDFTIQFAIRLPDGELYLSPMSGAVVTWSSREGAEHVLAQLREYAQSMGIREYAGAIVRRYCTPFVGEGQDVAAEMFEELTKWLAQNSGGAQS
jgi:hypothetical protein